MGYELQFQCLMKGYISGEHVARPECAAIYLFASTCGPRIGSADGCIGYKLLCFLMCVALGPLGLRQLSRVTNRNVDALYT